MSTSKLQPLHHHRPIPQTLTLPNVHNHLHPRPRPRPISALAAAISSSDMNGGFYSPAKAAARPLFSPRFPPFQRLRHFFCARKLRLVASVFLLCFVVLLSSRLSSLIGWLPPHSNTSFPRGGGHTVLMNTWKQSSALKQSVIHYATCDGVAAIHVVWSDSDPHSETMKARLENQERLKNLTLGLG